MDRITKSYIEDFTEKFAIIDDDISTKFEHLANYTLVEPKTENTFDVESINIGNNGTIGIDGFALILNKQLVDTEDMLMDILENHSNISAEFVFIQTKTSASFDTGELLKFGNAVKDFISENQSLAWTTLAAEKISQLNKVIKRTLKLNGKPKCYLYYTTTGKTQDDANLNSMSQSIKQLLESENIFSDVMIELIGAPELQDKYRKIGQAIKKSFNFEKRIPLPNIVDVKEAYLGMVPASTIVDLISNESGEITSHIFYDNVRDFQGDNVVNKDIKQSLESNDKELFILLNNGVTIIAEDINFSREECTIVNYQIINGCQTSHVLSESQASLNNGVLVPIKLIATKNVQLTEKLICSTNNQTEVKKQDLLAFSAFQKKLETFYNTFSENARLYYERRSKQYNREGIPKKKIIDKTTQIKSVASFFYDKPDQATRYFGSLMKSFDGKLFLDTHFCMPYYTAAFFHYYLNEMFRQKRIDKKYKKIRYFILMMLRYELSKDAFPQFSSKKIEGYCSGLIDKINCSHIDNIINKLDSLELDLTSSEISKSKNLVNKCMSFYN